MFTRERIHHAYVIEGEKETILKNLFRQLSKELKVERIGNPDFFFEEFDVLGIDDARRIKDIQSNSTFGGGKKIFVTSLNSITREAQNSLLKVLEEPTADTHFFIVIPTLSKLLPTFISRVEVVSEKNTSPDLKEAKEFAQSSVARRLIMIKKITENKDKAGAIVFLKNLASYLSNERIDKLSENKLKALNIISKNISYLGDRSSSVKLILESVALTL